MLMATLPEQTPFPGPGFCLHPIHNQSPAQKTFAHCLALDHLHTPPQHQQDQSLLSGIFTLCWVIQCISCLGELHSQESHAKGRK